MKRIIGLLLTLALVLICALALADVIVNEMTFPDETFRNMVKTFDTDGSGKLSDAEIAAVTEISCEKKGNHQSSGDRVFYSTGIPPLRR